jgi:hypothetical protein
MLGAWWAGFLAAEMGDAETAAAEAQRARPRHRQVQPGGLLGDSYLTVGEVGRAIGRLDEGLTWSAEAEVRPHESWFGACLAEAWSLGGEPARARTLSGPSTFRVKSSFPGSPA